MSIDLTKLIGRWGRRVDLVEQTRVYKNALLSPTSKQYILPDLAEFCGVLDPAPSDGDQFKQGRAAGRRDVWLHMQSFLNLEPHEIYALLKGSPIINAEDFQHGRR